MSPRIEILLPCSVFFAQNRVSAGVIAMLMQLTLVLWPAATRWADNLNERLNIERMLAELSETHRVPVDPYARPLKTFRQTA